MAADKGKTLDINLDVEFEAKRRHLLSSLASGGIDVEKTEVGIVNNTDNALTTSVAIQDELATISGVEQAVPRTQGSPNVPDSSAHDNQASCTPNKSAEDTLLSSEPLKRRSKLEVATTKRFIFGALGLRTPKTKQDEKDIRDKLMKLAKPGMEIHNAVEDMVQSKNIHPVNIANHSWSDKIVLRGIECVQEGIVLSTPSFPFVQRWDPQQRTNTRDSQPKRRGGKGKKRKRNNMSYYQQHEQLDYDDAADNGELSLDHEVSMYDANQASISDIAPKDRSQSVISEQLLRDTTIQQPPMLPRHSCDWPTLPKNITTFDLLTQPATKAGMIVAFKQLDMSQETNWQPQVSDYRIGIIDKVSDDGHLVLTLADRDRPRREMLHDPHTGERLYSKFEMPDYEDETEADAGILEINYSEMIDPKLVKDTSFQPSAELRYPQFDVLQAGRIDISASEYGGKETSDIVKKDGKGDNRVEIAKLPEVIGPLMRALSADPCVSLVNGVNEAQTGVITEQTGQQITQSINDAGIRSNINAVVIRELEDRSNRIISDDCEHEGKEEKASNGSPNLISFISSSPEETMSLRSTASLHGLATQAATNLTENDNDMLSTHYEKVRNPPEMLNDIPRDVVWTKLQLDGVLDSDASATSHRQIKRSTSDSDAGPAQSFLAQQKIAGAVSKKNGNRGSRIQLDTLFYSSDGSNSEGKPVNY